MKPLLKITLVTLSLLILIAACGKETQTTTQGGGTFKIRLTVSPSLQTGNVGSAANSFQVISQTPSLPALSYMWNGKTTLSAIETNEVSVTKGQNVTIAFVLGNQLNPVCHTVKIEGLINGKVIQTFTKEAGYSNLNPPTVCKDFYNNSVNFIIP